MIYRRLALFALFFLAMLPAANAQQKPEAQEVSGKIKWIYDYEEGRQQSLNHGKPMFVVFRCER